MSAASTGHAVTISETAAATFVYKNYLYKELNIYLYYLSMCGIWLFISKKKFTENDFKSFNKLSPRGPDYFKTINININFNNNYLKYITLGFHRLSIIDTTMRGSQPFEFIYENKIIYVMCNGEIYNYKKLIKYHNLTVNSSSDCEVLQQLYIKYGFDKMIKLLRGEFSIILIESDMTTNEYKFFIGRDQVGVRPLYYGINHNFICFSSLLKGIPSLQTTLCNQFIPGNYISFTNKKFQNIIDKGTLDYINHYDLNKKQSCINNEKEALKLIHDEFIKCVEYRMNSDVPIGALLSGGLDSSIICAIASRYLKSKGKRLRTFSIGLKNSTDEYYAKMVSKYINSLHTHITIPENHFINAIEQTIYTVESYDTTTIRASVGQYLISKYISENYDIKVLLIGDGSDELTGGYMYFHNAPSPTKFHNENIRLLKDIHKYDGQRADRCISHNGLESRVPFLDYNFIDLYLRIDPSLRMPRIHNGKKMEKYLLRKAFEGFLPEKVLWRHKEAFSDGVSSLKKSWYEIIQEMANKKYTNDNIKEITTGILPKTAEEYMFRKIFEKYFTDNTTNVIPYFWLPKWSGKITEPSARILQINN